MNPEPIHVLLADDDTDDCLFFEEVLAELSLTTRLTTVHNGEQLMQLLVEEKDQLPQILFLDLNIPRKNGFECLSAIKLNPRLKGLFVIIFSTSAEQEIVNKLYENGAQHYIRKPAEFSRLKKVVHQAITLSVERGAIGQKSTVKQPLQEHFVLTGDY